MSVGHSVFYVKSAQIAPKQIHKHKVQNIFTATQRVEIKNAWQQNENQEERCWKFFELSLGGIVYKLIEIRRKQQD